MQRDRAEELAIQELDRHNLPDWKFQWDTTRRILGRCYHARKTIALSVHYVDLNPEHTVLDTIRHEVAHALAGASAGHGPVWADMCRITGAVPRSRKYANVPSTRVKITLEDLGL